MNSNLNVIFEYAKEPLMSDPSALSIFIENPRAVTGFFYLIILDSALTGQRY
jgi:hypothetical protein